MNFFLFFVKSRKESWSISLLRNLQIVFAESFSKIDVLKLAFYSLQSFHVFSILGFLKFCTVHQSNVMLYNLEKKFSWNTYFCGVYEFLKKALFLSPRARVRAWATGHSAKCTVKTGHLWTNRSKKLIHRSVWNFLTIYYTIFRTN